ncbi:hypothetical protein AKJ16_DCAP00016 [Drosera capensis]
MCTKVQYRAWVELGPTPNTSSQRGYLFASYPPSASASSNPSFLLAAASPSLPRRPRRRQQFSFIIETSMI